MVERAWWQESRLICNQGAKGNKSRSSACCSLHIQSGAAAHEMVWATSRVGLPSSGKTFWKHPHRHIERFVSIATLNPLRLTVEINNRGAGVERGSGT